MKNAKSADQESVSESFGVYTFSLEQMRKRLPRPTFEAIEATIAAGEPLDMKYANEIAHGMKKWAIEHGATQLGQHTQKNFGVICQHLRSRRHDSLATGMDLQSDAPIEYTKWVIVND